jgi:hypothetical protein
MRKTLLPALLACASAACGTAVAAGPPGRPVLLELFTSEGCSSCPPADALLSQLAAEPGVVALELHVDYWDDLGWKDPFSQHAFSERQATYGQSLGRRGVYTPQVVVNGAAEGVGSDRSTINKLRSAAPALPAPVVVSARRDGDAIDVQASASGAPAGADLLVAIAESGLVTDVRRGENSGRRLAHGAVVRRLETVPASGKLRIPVEPAWQSGKLSVVAILQAPHGGPVLGVTRVQLD